MRSEINDALSEYRCGFIDESVFIKRIEHIVDANSIGFKMIVPSTGFRKLLAEENNVQ